MKKSQPNEGKKDYNLRPKQTKTVMEEIFCKNNNQTPFTFQINCLLVLGSNYAQYEI